MPFDQACKEAHSLGYEAIEIARKFSSPESVQFINGVLDSVGRDLEKARP